MSELFLKILSKLCFPCECLFFQPSSFIVILNGEYYMNTPINKTFTLRFLFTTEIATEYSFELVLSISGQKKMFINLSMCIFNLKTGAHTSLFSRLENVHRK